jgi:hypothetical protein
MPQFDRNFSHNEVGGNIDTFMTGLSTETYDSLAILDLSHNNFTGPLPNLSSWIALQTL